MESALRIPEVLDSIFLLAEPSAQAAAAQTCQYWSTHSLPWLWRDMKSFYPLLELLSSLVYKDGAWEFTSELFSVDWERFGRYAGYIRSIHYDQDNLHVGREGLPSSQTLLDILLHRPTLEGSMFPNLNRIQWTVNDGQGLKQLLLFLVPTITSLRINCREPLEGACLYALKVLTPRNILLTELRIAMPIHTQAFLEGLPDVLAGQRRLIRVGLPNYSASQGVVAALAALPFLEEYESWSFVAHQTLLGIGMDFEWPQGGFTALKNFALITSLANAAQIMSRPHQPRLNDFLFISREFIEHAHLHNFCSSLSAFQSNLTFLYLSLYSHAAGPDLSSKAIPFDRIRPLLLCMALQKFCIRSDRAMMYNDMDITSMASAWPHLKTLSLCADPVSDVGLATGQPLQSVESFAHSFNALRELSLYVTTLNIDVIARVSTGPSQCRLSILNFGTSPVPTDSTNASDPSTARYVASLLEPRAEVKTERSQGHTRFLRTSAAAKAEYSHREQFWSSFSTEVHFVLSSTTNPMQEVSQPLRGSIAP